MSDLAIQAEGLCKLYRLGARERYRTLRDSLTDTLKAPFRRSTGRTTSEANPESFWALSDISFAVKHGEVIGVIGRNGAGKSTLLKILSRITEPTRGEVRIRGRIASLLEVGTGFHPELSGRDNIYLNGAILGMKRAEIRRKFDEIVEFAEIQKFIDTPVKHYSSGMYVRLAFAVAAHLEPEILIVDEVLAVGDHQFQSRCLNKMSEVGQSGRTIFFVSHSMSAIQRLCQRVIVLSGGRIVADTDPEHAIARYLGTDTSQSWTADPSPSRPSITHASAELSGESLRISIRFESPFPLNPPVFGFVLYDSLGHPVVGANSRQLRGEAIPPATTTGTMEAIIPTGNIRPGQYFISLWLAGYYQDYSVLEKILQVQLEGGSLSDNLPAHIVGNVCLPTVWRYEAGISAGEEVGALR